MVSWRASALLCGALAAALGGCEKSASSEGKAAAKSDEPAELIAAWQKANLTVSAFTADKNSAIGSACQSGTVSGVDVVLCTFATAEEAKAAEAKALEWVGAATGTALSKDKVLVAVVDRRAADPSGRTINAVTKALR
ncbi:MAG: hypothetical protein R3B48_20565 [Kofleriaceae bacterium]